MFECEKCGWEMRLTNVIIDDWGDSWNDADTDTNFYIAYIKHFNCPHCGNTMEIECSAIESNDY